MRYLAFTILSLLLAGCATGYVPSGGGDGYSETQLADDNYQITFRGNVKTTQERAHDFALLRGAEIALSKGYPYITISFSATGDNGSAGVVVNNLMISKRKPEVSINVRMSKTKANSGYLDAAFVRKNIRTKYELGD